MDGVIVDFIRGAHEHHKLKYDPWPYPVGKWDFVKRVDKTAYEFWSPLKFDFWSTLPWTPDGEEILSMLPFEDTCLLTAPTQEAECVTGKLRWVRDNLTGYNRKVIITPAKEMCAHPNALLIDDGDHNVDKWRANGGQAILVPRIWNSRHAECNNKCNSSTVEILRKEISDAGIRNLCEGQ
jgi:hypothetical protein